MVTRLPTSDDSGRTTKVTSKKADGTELAHVSYAYDTFDNMTEIVRGGGMKYALAYNEFHNLQSIGIEGKAEALIKYAYKNGNGRDGILFVVIPTSTFSKSASPM